MGPLGGLNIYMYKSFSVYESDQVHQVQMVIDHLEVLGGGWVGQVEDGDGVRLATTTYFHVSC